MRRLSKQLCRGKCHAVAAIGIALAIVAAPVAIAKPRTPKAQETAAAPRSNSPLIIVASLRNQRLRVFDVDGEITSSRISSGRPGFATPTGVFSILEKKVQHRSNIYAGAEMPYMERLTWSGIALHAGVVPGYRASHGCVRLPHSFARTLYSMTKLGGRVVITATDAEPVAFSSPKLFKPLPLDDKTAMKLGSSGHPRVAVNDKPDDTTTDALPDFPLLIGISPALARAVADMPRDPQRRPATRVEVDQLMQERITRLQATLKSADAAQTAALAKIDESAKEFAQAERQLQDAQRSGEPLRAAVKNAELRQQDAIRAFSAFMSSGTGSSLTPDAMLDREADLENAVLQATRDADDARTNAAKTEWSFAEVQARYSAAKAARDNVSIALRNAQTDLISAKRELADANNDVRLRSKSISVFVSLRAQRLYVRQGTEPVLEAPISVAPLPGPVGTHVFTAMRYGEDPNTFDWRLVSAQVPAAGKTFLDDVRKRRGDAAAPAGNLSVRMATAALSAFAIPDDIMSMISERARPGASLIVSDRELPDHENGSGTEFVVLTK
ncbi:ErfK/YbiS/YcfS/YnhG family protein [Hyphomicrobium denitrificans ATCC 51888]|uniref:ErfK/YbiS/YcfS/YnhG family protein n=1 Tax=Hyphomicrobium denitrificans (strain ATCC 51888 / DSM 1869 / NCIMB 11706 / TK 0415) TaxID=582899 RepID=D8JU81_HYPDA|nr:L,D-transpeptidase family protein [Hyphomicrobium denitrificans]ADJ22671.1 ErfK/YbiS/YcfS/YnhG family protein [Hyphomicrobium denitrificans ATCC 51888]